MVDKIKKFVGDPWKLQAYKSIIGTLMFILLTVIAFTVNRGFAKLDKTAQRTNDNTVIVERIVVRLDVHEEKIKEIKKSSDKNREGIEKLKF